MSDVLTRIRDSAPRCARGCPRRAVRNGYCDECACEIEQDIDFDDVASSQFVLHGRVYYAGESLPDRFGGGL